jgi:hypothetical protein
MPDDSAEHPLHVVEGKTLSKERIVLDGYKYSRCVFSDCEIAYSGGWYVLDNCTQSGCHFLFSGAAHRTLQLLRGLCENPKARSELFPSWLLWKRDNRKMN